MTDARGREIVRLFEAAAPLPATERAAFLREACPDDKALRLEVGSLLKQLDRSEPRLRTSLLHDLVAGLLPLWAPAADEETTAGHTDSVAGALVALDRAEFASGTTVGDRYRIVSLAGRGGMGEVYRADDLVLKHQPISAAYRSLNQTS